MCIPHAAMCHMFGFRCGVAVELALCSRYPQAKLIINKPTAARQLGLFWLTKQLLKPVICLQVMLLIFLSIGTLLIACFLGYHCSLIARGMTTYETFKWQDYKDHCLAVAQESRYALRHRSCCDVTDSIGGKHIHSWLPLQVNPVLLVGVVPIGLPPLSNLGSCGLAGLSLGP